MLLPSSMRINDPFSMKLEKVEPPPAPAKLTPYQEFEQISRDATFEPVKFGVDLAGWADYKSLIEEQSRYMQEALALQTDPPVVERPESVFEQEFPSDDIYGALTGKSSKRLRFKRYSPSPFDGAATANLPSKKPTLTELWGRGQTGINWGRIVGDDSAPQTDPASGMPKDQYLRRAQRHADREANERAIYNWAYFK